MELREAVHRLLRDAGDRNAMQALYEHTQAMARHMVREPELAEDVGTDAFLALYNRFERGDAEVNDPVGYVRRAVHNKHMDLRRRQASLAELSGREEAPELEREASGDAAEAKATLEELAEAFFARKVERHREGFREDWRLLKRAVFGGEQYSTLIAEKQGDKAWKTAENAFYKRQQRLREGFLQVLSANSPFDEDTTARLREAVRALVYCQKSKT
ncbi:MAG: hypothetical protein GY913_07100 [Proteobacteria bacterium]|nr:hypothetical protein [Pseudomonadota bacterium]MCP4916675.1 hypothetical protein [Pseudomonadota bacterium]